MQQQVRSNSIKTQSYELKVNSKVDIYHPEQKLLFDDGIQVKGQSPKGKDQGERRGKAQLRQNPSCGDRCCPVAESNGGV